MYLLGNFNIYSNSTDLLSTYYVSGTVLSAEDSTVNNTAKLPAVILDIDTER